ncbi:aminodeoxychorismate synthase component I [Algivirga pacifica]|uniref:aminodeoxychorismate synthase n=1 Tax=Algivirga pacifica TaxID=1162670 RepID=A0ABP9DCF0_9BACT
MVSFNQSSGQDQVLLTYRPSSLKEFRQRALQWASSHNVCTWLDNNEIPYPEGGFQALLAIGEYRRCPIETGQSFESIQRFHQQRKTWLFGYWGYDLKNEVELLSSNNTDDVALPDIYFYEPTYLLRFTDEEVEVLKAEEHDAGWVIHQIELTEVKSNEPIEPLAIQQKVSRDTYIQTVEQIQQHIIEGDVYELNFCMEFFAEQAKIHPLSVYRQLNEVSPMPFSAYLQLGEHFVLSASPERFIRKEGARLLSQPIKGTIRRGKTEEEDLRLKEQLRNDEKEIAENMMIVDLVRNDLSRTCKIGTVKVPELFGIYGFRQVYQMISSIEGELQDHIHPIQAIKAAFPMGSMTGAPKVMSMELIERYEHSKRGLYSGAIGYITPEGDFDFNVVIRSILYNQEKEYLSFQIGSAITIDSSPEKEYEECLLKAKAIRTVLSGE